MEESTASILYGIAVALEYQSINNKSERPMQQGKLVLLDNTQHSEYWRKPHDAFLLCRHLRCRQGL